MTLRITYEVLHERCLHCGQPQDVVRGPIHEEKEGLGLYLAALHDCDAGHVVILTIALDASEPSATTLQAWAAGEEILMSILEGDLSPWRDEVYLGKMLTAKEARASKKKALVFEVADLVCTTIPDVRQFLNEADY